MSSPGDRNKACNLQGLSAPLSDVPVAGFRDRLRRPSKVPEGSRGQSLHTPEFRGQIEWDPELPEGSDRRRQNWWTDFPMRHQESCRGRAGIPRTQGVPESLGWPRLQTQSTSAVNPAVGQFAATSGRQDRFRNNGSALPRIRIPTSPFVADAGAAETAPAGTRGSSLQPKSPLRPIRSRVESGPRNVAG